MTSRTMREFQESSHGHGFDYTTGSSHLKHDALRGRVVQTVLDAVRTAVAEGRSPRVLEVGAGHGSLTEALVDAGATVVVTETSEPSVQVLRQRLDGDDRVTVVHDPDGTAPADGDFDAVVYVSVLHHIPDYLTAVALAAERIRPGGTFVSMQDLMLFARQTRFDRAAASAMYLVWRLSQGEFRGLATRLRRARAHYDDSQPSDMVEYHAVRGGVDETALEDMLRQHFDDRRARPPLVSPGGDLTPSSTIPNARPRTPFDRGR